MTDPSSLSRRALFGLARARLEPVAAAAAKPRHEAQQEAAPVPSLSDLRERQRAAWARGDGAALWRSAADALVEHAGVGSGERILDAGAGTGSVAACAAQRGAAVTACDLAVPPVGRGGTAPPGTEWHVADLEALPFPDDAFDRVLSGFAPMFCLDAPSALRELFRVARPGGTVAFTAWTAGGVVGRLLRLATAWDPLPPGVPAPIAWGREERLRQDLGELGDDIAFDTRTLRWHFASVDEATTRLVDAFGPLAAAIEHTPEPERAALRDEAEAAIREHARSHPAGLELRARHLVATARA